MKKLIFISLFVMLAKFAGAQEQLSVRQMADKLFDRYEYFKSVNLYLKLVKSKTDVAILERIAECYRNINRYEDAENWYAKVVADPKASPVNHYYYAEVLHRQQKFDLAKQQYRLYLSNDPARLKLKLNACDTAAFWIKQPTAVKITNTESLNTEFSDWGLNYEGASGFSFTSDRLVDDQLDNRTGNNWFKLYDADLKNNTTKIFPLVFGNIDIFSNEYHIGPVAFNKTADTAYITITTYVLAKNLPIDNSTKTDGQKLYTRRLQLIMAGKKDDKWKVYAKFPYNDVRLYSIGDAALSQNGHVIYFTSDMPGGEGKTDIWYCEKLPGGGWGKPINCGKTINTKEEEEFPTIGGDGALYYASKGLPGMGGYDIYKAKGEKAKWTAPENLKYPINTTSDDFYLITKDGLNGYLSSNRDGGKGSDDIYSFAVTPVKKVPSKPVAKTFITKPNPAPMKTPQGFLLGIIYYDLDKSNIRPDAIIEMDKLVELLKQKPGLKIELASYTDSRASDQYNVALSQRRASSALEYLVGHSIAVERLTARFYGETHLVNQCADDVQCTEEQHQLNRRTEFKVIGGGD